MMEFNKKELLEHLEARVGGHMDTAISLFQNQPESVLLKLSVTGGWSIAQCLDHLNSYGHFYLPRLKASLQLSAPSNVNEFKSGWLGNYFANMMEPSNKKYKAMKGHIPIKHLDPYKVISEFIKQQEELLVLLRTAQTRAIDARLPISISVLIRLKTGDVFRFLIAHNERHVKQALRNIS